jgi:hypothetical protein
VISYRGEWFWSAAEEVQAFAGKFPATRLASIITRLRNFSTKLRANIDPIGKADLSNIRLAPKRTEKAVFPLMRVETLSRHSPVIDRSRKPVYGGLNVSQHCDEDDNHCNHDRCLKTLVAVADRELPEAPCPDRARHSRFADESARCSGFEV